MSTIEDFENAPVGATATRNTTGSRAVKTYEDKWSWVPLNGFYSEDTEMAKQGCTLDPPAPTTAREALDLAWELAHPVKEGQIIPKGTRYLQRVEGDLREYTEYRDTAISKGRSILVRTLDLPPDPLPDWLDAPAVIATPGWGPDREVWVPKSGGYWKCPCCRTDSHWTDLRDVIPLYPKGQEA